MPQDGMRKHGRGERFMAFLLQLPDYHPVHNFIVKPVHGCINAKLMAKWKNQQVSEHVVCRSSFQASKQSRFMKSRLSRLFLLCLDELNLSMQTYCSLKWNYLGIYALIGIAYPTDAWTEKIQRELVKYAAWPLYWRRQFATSGITIHQSWF